MGNICGFKVAGCLNKARLSAWRATNPNPAKVILNVLLNLYFITYPKIISSFIVQTGHSSDYWQNAGYWPAINR